MARYNFVSPGALGGNAIEQFLMQREAENRQRMLDEFAMATTQQGQRQRADEFQLEQQREARIAAAQQQEIERQRAQDAQTQSAGANAMGVRQMMADAATSEPLTPERAQQISMVGYREGVETPSILDQFLQPKPAAQPFTLNPGDVRFGPDGKELARVAPKPQSDGPQQAWQWVMRGGKQVYTNQVQPGDTPASRSGGGRSVLSGDAGRIAEFDTSLDDADVLEKEMGTTGASSQVGAMLPNVVTELTGWGSDAKARQAVINRVKQVIGKALEGGVLRKEDEQKYKDILPTIGDAPDVAKAKVTGLKSAIQQRRQRLIESLEDAGFDVSKYPAERTPAGNALDPLLDELLSGK